MPKNLFNGLPITRYQSKSKEKTIFIPIPRHLAADIEHGCGCAFCKQHPELPPKWDAMAVACDPTAKKPDAVSTCHYPALGVGLEANALPRLKSNRHPRPKA